MAQWLALDFWYGTVAAITFLCDVLCDGFGRHSTSKFNSFQFEEIQHGRGECDQYD
jgi:hypothetical protein